MTSSPSLPRDAKLLDAFGADADDAERRSRRLRARGYAAVLGSGERATLSQRTASFDSP